MSPESVPDPNAPQPPKHVRVHQQKAQFFRVVHADGVWCSVNAFQNFNLTFYSERHPIPTSIYYTIDGNGFVTAEDVKKREVKEGWFRELEVNVVLSLPAARIVRDTLDFYIKGTEEQIKATQPKP